MYIVEVGFMATWGSGKCKTLTAMAAMTLRLLSYAFCFPFCILSYGTSRVPFCLVLYPTVFCSVSFSVSNAVI